MIKFRYCEKASKICGVAVFSNFVAFSQYLNFTTLQISEADYTPATDRGLLKKTFVKLDAK